MPSIKYLALIAILALAPDGASGFDRYAALSSSKRDKSELAKAMSLIISAAMPTVSAVTRDNIIKDYEGSQPHKGQAVELVEAHFWRSSLHEKQNAAGDRALEGCQMRYNRPCALIAVDDEISAEGELKPKDMSRLHYSGKFDLDQIPVMRLSTRKVPDVQNYDHAMEPKAMAIHPWGSIFTAVGNPTLKEAEETALARCNNDQRRNGQDGPCFLYSINNDVVLPQRLTAPK
jgi:hypothetical protein